MIITSIKNLKRMVNSFNMNIGMIVNNQGDNGSLFKSQIFKLSFQTNRIIKEKSSLNKQIESRYSHRMISSFP